MDVRRLLLFGRLLAASALAQTNWTVTRFDLPNVSTTFGIAYGKGRFVATVQGGPRGQRLATSVDGIAWQDTPVNGGGKLFYFGDAFVYAGGGGVWRSADGLTWQQIYNHYPQYAGTSIQTATHNGRGMLLDGGFRNGVLMYSEDLVTWTPTTSLPNSGQPGASVSIAHLAFGAGRYFVVYGISGTTGFNGSYTASSVDGRAWVLVPQLQFAQGIAGGNGRLVAIMGGEARVTTDGTTFTSTSIPGDMTNPQALFFAGGRFFAARTLHASVDGLTWARLAPINKPDAVNVQGLAYGNGRYVMVGYQIVPPFDTVDVLAYLNAAAPPVIATQPGASRQPEGGRATFAVALDNPDVSTTFQWRRDGVVIPGATNPTLVIEPVLATSAGRYSVDVRNIIGATTSDPAPLTVVPIAEAGRLINLSVLTDINAPSGPDATFTVGFVVGGAGTTGGKSLIVRAVGPSLSRFGVTGPVADPKLELFAGSVKVGENDNWSGTTAIVDASTRVGAFPLLAPDSKDAALVSDNVAIGDASLRVSANAGGVGPILAEVYDATPLASLTASTPRLLNVSVLKQIAAGATLSAGFVIGGTTEKTVLIRAVGPGLSPFNVAGVLGDPRLSLFRSGVAAPIAANDDWGGSPDLAARFAAVGAFNLLATSRDAALLVTLAPGNYVAQASGGGVSGGVALVEIYEVP